MYEAELYLNGELISTWRSDRVHGLCELMYDIECVPQPIAYVYKLLFKRNGQICATQEKDLLNLLLQRIDYPET